MAAAAAAAAAVVVAACLASGVEGEAVALQASVALQAAAATLFIRACR